MTSSGKGPRLWSSGPFSALQRSRFSSLSCRSLIFKIELCFKYIQLILLLADESEELSFKQADAPCHAPCPTQHVCSLLELQTDLPLQSSSPSPHLVGSSSRYHSSALIHLTFHPALNQRVVAAECALPEGRGGWFFSAVCISLSFVCTRLYKHFSYLRQYFVGESSLK